MELKGTLKRILFILTAIIFSDYITYVIACGVYMDTLTMITIFSFYFVASILSAIYLKNKNTTKCIIKLKYKRWIYLSGYIILMIGITFSFEESLFKEEIEQTKVNIIALGEKNGLSQGTEVWIVDISNNNKKEDLDQMKPSVGWEIRDNAIVSFQNQPAQLEMMLTSNSEITFVKHQFSGKVKIIDGEEESIVDLYSNDGGNYVYNTMPVSSTIKNMIRKIEYVYIVALVGVFFLKKEHFNIK